MLKDRFLSLGAGALSCGISENSLWRICVAMTSNKAGSCRAGSPLASHQEDGLSNGTGPTSLQQLSKWCLPTGAKQQPHKEKIVGFSFNIPLELDIVLASIIWNKYVNKMQITITILPGVYFKCTKFRKIISSKLTLWIHQYLLCLP